MAMKFINFIILTISLFLIGCTTTPPAGYTAGTMTCVHKYDESRVVTYDKNNITQYVINDVVTFYILDINGNDVFLNIHEIENYICEENI